MMKKISNSRAVYEVNLHGDSGTAPGPNRKDNMKVRPNEEARSTQRKSLNPMKEGEKKFKFTRFPVRKQEAVNVEEESTSSASVK